MTGCSWLASHRANDLELEAGRLAQASAGTLEASVVAPTQGLNAVDHRALYSIPTRAMRKHTRHKQRTAHAQVRGKTRISNCQARRAGYCSLKPFFLSPAFASAMSCARRGRCSGRGFKAARVRERARRRGIRGRGLVKL